MQIQFFLDGVVVPALHDFDLSSEGALRPTVTRKPDKEYVAILLENSGSGITLAQAIAVNTLLIANPNSEVDFYFDATGEKVETVH